MGGSQKVKFKGNEYYLIGYLDDPDSPFGYAIATEEQYAAFADSFAHLFGNGPGAEIKRHNEIIGRFEDLEFIPE